MQLADPTSKALAMGPLSYVWLEHMLVHLFMFAHDVICENILGDWWWSHKCSELFRTEHNTLVGIRCMEILPDGMGLQALCAGHQHSVQNSHAWFIQTERGEDAWTGQLAQVILVAAFLSRSSKQNRLTAHSFIVLLCPSRSSLVPDSLRNTLHWCLEICRLLNFSFCPFGISFGFCLKLFSWVGYFTGLV